MKFNVGNGARLDLLKRGRMYVGHGLRDLSQSIDGLSPFINEQYGEQFERLDALLCTLINDLDTEIRRGGGYE